MTIKCITANLQGGQDDWLSQLASEEIDIAFLQEAPHELPKEFADAYDICKYNETASHPAYRCRTLIAVRREASLNPKTLEVPTATYHRSYVAGDFNEARDSNLLDPEWGIWGTQYFEKAKSELGLFDVTWSEWKGECATHGDAQLDHILATEDLRSHLIHSTVLENENTYKSDHHPITWSIA